MKVESVAVGLVGLVVAVIFVGLVAVPVIEDSVSGTPYSGTNASDHTYTYIDSSPTFTWVRSAAGEVTLTMNGTTTTVPKDSNNFMVASDKLTIRTIGSGAQLWDYGNSTYTLSNDADIEINLSVTAGSYTLDFGGTTTTGTISWALLTDPNGTWGLYTGNLKVTLGQPVFVGHLYGNSMGAAYGLTEFVDGSPGEAIISPYYFSGTSITAVADVTYAADYELNGGGQAVGLYKGATCSYGGNDYAAQIYAPLDFESSAQSSGDTNSTLLMMIPVLLIIVAVVMAARMISGRN